MWMKKSTNGHGKEKHEVFLNKRKKKKQEVTDQEQMDVEKKSR
jgi:hypothetical protein